jgi:DUF438 domain-containing protein
MSELINNSKKRVEELKKLILQLHEGYSVEETKSKLTELMGSVPYGDVVQAEEELIQEGLDREEVLKFCDIHSEALRGKIDTSHAKEVPAGHPVDTFRKENLEITKLLKGIKDLFEENSKRDPNADSKDILASLNSMFNQLMDIDKHYMRKENQLFPYLEKYEITGPPMVMWGKDDEIRGLLKSCFSLFKEQEEATAETVNGFIEMMFAPTVKAIEDMIYKEEEILFPMSMDTLTEIDWYEIYEQSDETGYCLFYPEIKWEPNITIEKKDSVTDESKVKFSTGALKLNELESMINSLPIDLTFVDKDDRVRYFSHGKERIFDRPKTILGREVKFCHPPSSVHIVNEIVDDFKSGRQDSAKFWINVQGKFVHIAYYAVRDENGEYLGTVEMSQEIGEYRELEGERRILQYDEK